MQMLPKIQSLSLMPLCVLEKTALLLPRILQPLMMMTLMMMTLLQMLPQDVLLVFL